MKIKFLPQNISVDIKPGKSVMDVVRENKLPVSSSCNGMCSCAECRVYVVEGEAHILPPSAKEVELIGGGYFIDNRRLSCQLFCFGDVTIDLSEQVEKEKEGGVIKKQILKKLSKDNTEESSSVGGILVEQDEDMTRVQVSEERDEFSTNDFYKKEDRKNIQNRRDKKWSKGPHDDKTFEFQQRENGGKRSHRKKRRNKGNKKSHYRRKRN